MDLLPCPFCGEDGIIVEATGETSGNLGKNISLPWSSIKTFYIVRCSKCYCKLDSGWKSPDGAATEWNDRHQK